jgi:2,3-bisphosphoglycerate-independent phosphoglycerate mutase
MKYVVVIGDGMADYPLEELDGKTPLQKAETPNMDKIARNGVCGMLKTVPDGMEAGSDVANLSIMGYDPHKYYTGRGPLEAASMGAELNRDDVAFRCNLINTQEGILSDFNAGHITTAEASEIIEYLNQSFYQYGRFYLGTSYRHLFVFPQKEAANLRSTPPHDVVGEPLSQHRLQPAEDDLALELNQLMDQSRVKLENHPVNQKRSKEGLKTANMIWLWGQGVKPQIPSFKSKYGLKGATVTGVDLIKGLGIYLGLSNIKVPGATGYYDTDYCGKVNYALEALEDHDLVFIHVEAPDEAGHAGDLQEKISAIERIDKRILGKLCDELPHYDDFALAILPDHLTPLSVRTHTPEPVPYAMCKSGGVKDAVDSYHEVSVRKGSQGLREGHLFLKNFIEY